MIANSACEKFGANNNESSRSGMHFFRRGGQTDRNRIALFGKSLLMNGGAMCLENFNEEPFPAACSDTPLIKNQ